MVILYIIGGIYLFAGFVYALYIWLNGINKFSAFFINMIGGPAVLVRNYYHFYLKRKNV